VGPSRQILLKLFNGEKIPFNPVTSESGSRYEFQGTASVSRLLVGRAKEVASPTGIDGFCKGLNGSWGIPFKGLVNAA
jgi:hypothetical protein